VIVSLLWFALSAQWMTVVPIIVPDQVAVILAVTALQGAISGIISRPELSWHSSSRHSRRAFDRSQHRTDDAGFS